MKNIRFFYRYTCFNLWASSLSMVVIIYSLIFQHAYLGLYFAILTGMIHLSDAFLKLPAYKDLGTYPWRIGFLISTGIFFTGVSLLFFLQPHSILPELLFILAGTGWSILNTIIFIKDKNELKDILQQKELIYF